MRYFIILERVRVTVYGIGVAVILPFIATCAGPIDLLKFVILPVAHGDYPPMEFSVRTSEIV